MRMKQYLSKNVRSLLIFKLINIFVKIINMAGKLGI